MRIVPRVTFGEQQLGTAKIRCLPSFFPATLALLLLSSFRHHLVNPTLFPAGSVLSSKTQISTSLNRSYLCMYNKPPSLHRTYPLVAPPVMIVAPTAGFVHSP